jgi:hypothetical protein
MRATPSRTTTGSSARPEHPTSHTTAPTPHDGGDDPGTDLGDDQKAPDDHDTEAPQTTEPHETDSETHEKPGR